VCAHGRLFYLLAAAPFKNTRLRTIWFQPALRALRN